MDPKSSVCETLWGAGPREGQMLQALPHPALLSSPLAARRREGGSRAVMLCEAGAVTQPLCAQV